jgi:transcription elongation GreA/GreB family factor
LRAGRVETPKFAKGSVSYVSPLAAVLVGKSVGDTIKVAGSDAEIIAIA